MKEDKEIREFYSRQDESNKYDSVRFRNGGLVVDESEKKLVMNLAKTEKMQNILDVATGTGRFARLFSKDKKNKVFGFDYSKKMIKILKENKENYFEKVRGDAKMLPFKNNSFDCVTSMRFMIHYDDLSVFLKEMSRVSKKHIIFDTPNKYSLKTIVSFATNVTKKIFGFSYMSWFSEKDMRKTFDSLNLKVIGVRKTFFLPQGIYRFLPYPLARAAKRIDDFILHEILKGRMACAHTWMLAVKR
ncbi:MAG: methyltransferase domain-containing protein [Nanohaloarchaea archaeon]|nr:methyltransferase domain-containing protein [Candidatus Nanohaloarchaea archaeon]